MDQVTRVEIRDVDGFLIEQLTGYSDMAFINSPSSESTWVLFVAGIPLFLLNLREIATLVLSLLRDNGVWVSALMELFVFTPQIIWQIRFIASNRLSRLYMIGIVVSTLFLVISTLFFTDLKDGVSMDLAQRPRN